MNSTTAGGLTVATVLYDFVSEEVLPGLEMAPEKLWRSLEEILAALGARNAALLRERDALQEKIDAWHRAHPGGIAAAGSYRDFLREIGYLLAEGDEFQIDTQRVDAEIARVAGPQLVVPVSNARYALNAANARWGSLYDALYGTDALSRPLQSAGSGGYDAVRGAQVIAYARNFLDEIAGLESGSHRNASKYRLGGAGLMVDLDDGRCVTLAKPETLLGFQGDPASPAVLLFQHHGMHVEVHFDRRHPIGGTDPAGISDVVLEAALTAIQDCEDAVSAVDAADKVAVYRNWLGLMKGDLQATFEKEGRSRTRHLNEDRHYRSPAGQQFSLPGRSLMLVRNVGHHMLTDAVLTADGLPVPETFLDALITALIAVHDLRRTGPVRNSRTGSIYIVKPKLHGPAEAGLANELFDRVEDALGLPRNTIKMGIMDEERRTSVNLQECIRRVRHRVVFINTGFLDRTGDEIHTGMEAGRMIRKERMKSAQWLLAYENQNVDIGLVTGFSGRAQIGKGMWAMPGEMAAMLKLKIAQPRAGANTAWVPSPTAAVLHALHYHSVDVAAVQSSLRSRPRAPLDDLLTPPLADETLTPQELQRELDNNAQSILGYVVRWIDQGVGCSLVPDINNVGLMEDRATLRISSQLLANWLHHGVCTREQVTAALRRMALTVDRQNAADPLYSPMGADPDGNTAFQAALSLALDGRTQPNGYTEHILHAYRRRKKSLTGESFKI